MPAPRKPTTQPRSTSAPRLTLVRAADATPAEQGPVVPPIPLDTPLDESIELWAALWAEPQAAALTGAQRLVARRWIVAFDAWSRAVRAVELEPLVDGSQGQPVQNPLMAWVVSRETEMEKCEKQLGIGLRNRSDLGIAAAQARLTAAELNRMVTEGGEHGNGDDAAKPKTKGRRKRTGTDEADVLDGWEEG